jgi:hypothetical protein
MGLGFVYTYKYADEMSAIESWWWPAHHMHIHKYIKCLWNEKYESIKENN